VGLSVTHRHGSCKITQATHTNIDDASPLDLSPRQSPVRVASAATLHTCQPDSPEYCQPVSAILLASVAALQTAFFASRSDLVQSAGQPADHSLCFLFQEEEKVKDSLAICLEVTCTAHGISIEGLLQILRKQIKSSIQSKRQTVFLCIVDPWH